MLLRQSPGRVSMIIMCSKVSRSLHSRSTSLHASSIPSTSHPLRSSLSGEFSCPVSPPPSAQAETIRSYDGDVARLANAEQFFALLLRLPAYKTRLDGMLLKAEFQASNTLQYVSRIPVVIIIIIFNRTLMIMAHNKNSSRKRENIKKVKNPQKTPIYSSIDLH